MGRYLRITPRAQATRRDSPASSGRMWRPSRFQGQRRRCCAPCTWRPLHRGFGCWFAACVGDVSQGGTADAMPLPFRTREEREMSSDPAKAG